jgi:epoxyqueuosine reductase
MNKDIEESVMAIPADDEEHQEVRQAIDEFEEGLMMKSKRGSEAYYCVKYCRRCELVCPVGNLNGGRKKRIVDSFEIV